MTPSPGMSPGDELADVTQLLRAWSEGDRTAGDRLIAAVKDELHRQASRAMRHETTGHTLQPTALVNEAYLRLVDQRHVQWRNRAHFFGVSAELMRRILVDHARKRLSSKRGGGMKRLSIGAVDPADPASDPDRDMDILALHDALSRLAILDPEQERVVEMRYFGGMTIDETAEVSGTSPATVKRELAFARAWLLRELRPQ